MQYYGLAALLMGVAVAIVAAALRLGWRFEWLLGWLKGCVFLLILALAAAFLAGAWELRQFKAIDTGVPAAILEFRELAPQRYLVLMTVDGEVTELDLEGDLWEMDAQILRWTGFTAALGLADGYRLNKLSGRYLAIEQQRGRNGAGLTSLNATPAWRDLWVWLDRRHTPVLAEADAFSIRFMPLADGARFAIDISSTGITPAPLDPVAAEAFKRAE